MTTAWLLTFVYLQSIVAIPGIADRQACEALAGRLKVEYGFGTHKCGAYFAKRSH